jgi:O-antigen/teichoic acid export membrane protein
MADIRDVNEATILQRLKVDFHFILEFLKNPVQNISKLPPWSWKKTVAINILISVAAGTLNGMIPPNIYNIAFGIIFLPIITFLLIHILSGFFYYYFQVFEKRTVDYLNLLRLVVLANVPSMILHSLTSLLPPLTLIGLAFSALLLIVGLTESFLLDKRRSIKLVSIIYIIVFVVWLWEKIDTRKLNRAVSTSYEDIQ